MNNRPNYIERATCNDCGEQFTYADKAVCPYCTSEDVDKVEDEEE